MSPPPSAGTGAGEVWGWDVGGAHVKAARLRGGRLVDVVQWPCPLWKGLTELQAVLAAARDRWGTALSTGRVAVTMSGEMADGFADRRQGVREIAAALAAAFDAARVRLYAGAGGWLTLETLQQDDAAWARVASANWHATAQDAARRLGDALLIDFGSTTTDLIPLRGGRVATASASDADRMQRGELVYQGLVRTPLCALGPRIEFQGRPTRLMNEWFATSADVYRLTGELDPRHDQQPTADGGPKTPQASRLRLARMVGRDAAEAADEDWLALAQAFRHAQLAQISEALDEVEGAHGLADAPWVAAGCGADVIAALALARGRRCLRYGRDVVQAAHADMATDARHWAEVAAPAGAVASLLGVAEWDDTEAVRCGS